MREMHLFAGAGGGILGGLLLGHTPVCAVEIDLYCQKVLKQRQVDGILPEFPIYGDIKEFDGRPWKGQVDCVCGGFPCQDLSVAGKGVGIHGSRSSLFFELIRIVREVEPRFIFLENVPGLITRGIDIVLGALAELGFDAEWCVLSASDCGANHLRKRVWILCRKQLEDTNGNGGWSEGGDLVHEGRGTSESGPESVPEATGRENGATVSHLGATGEDVADTPSIGHGQGRESRDIYPTECGQDGEVRGFIGSTSSTSRDLADPISIRRQEQRYSEFSVNPEENGERKTDDVVNGCVGSPTNVAGDLADTECEGRKRRVHRWEDSERKIQLGRTGHSGSVHGQPVEDSGPPESGLGGMVDELPDWVDIYRASSSGWWDSEPPVNRLSIGTKDRTGRLRGLGNAQVPIVAATAFETLIQRYKS